MASGPITALDVGARRVGIPQTTGLAELRAAALSARRGQALRGPSMICGHRARVTTGAAPPRPREAPLRRGCALQMLGVWLGAAARAALISVPFAGTAASTYESSEGAGAPIAA